MSALPLKLSYGIIRQKVAYKNESNTMELRRHFNGRPADMSAGISSDTAYYLHKTLQISIPPYHTAYANVLVHIDNKGDASHCPYI